MLACTVAYLLCQSSNKNCSVFKVRRWSLVKLAFAINENKFISILQNILQKYLQKCRSKTKTEQKEAFSDQD